jgi:hypothetical protein
MGPLSCGGKNNDAPRGPYPPFGTGVAASATSSNGGGSAVAAGGSPSGVTGAATEGGPPFGAGVAAGAAGSDGGGVAPVAPAPLCSIAPHKPRMDQVERGHDQQVLGPPFLLHHTG